MARGKGDGSIRQRDDGRWEGRYTANGARKSVYGDSRTEVRDAIHRALESAANGFVDAEKIALGAYLDRWVENHVRPRQAFNTYKSYKTTIDRYIKPLIGGLPLRKLLPVHVSDMMGALAAAGKSKWVVRYSVVVLKAAVRQAKADKVLPINQIDDFKVPKQETPEFDYWTEEEVIKFFSSDKIDEALYPLFLMAAMGGSRHSELLGLRWGDIDFKAKRISISRILVRQKEDGKVAVNVFKDPKTKQSKRAFSMPAEVAKALRDLKEFRLKQGLSANPLVFCTSNGTPYIQENVRRAFYRAIEAAGVKRIKIHDLRHTCATLLLKKNVHPKIVQARLGHSKIGMTLDTYTAHLPTLDVEASEMLDEVFSTVMPAGAERG